MIRANKLFTLSILIILFLFSNQLTAQSSTTNWSQALEYPKAIIENKGQFDQWMSIDPGDSIKFGYEGKNEKIFFTPTGVNISLYKLERAIKTEDQRNARLERKKQGFGSAEEYRNFERAGHKMELTTENLIINWIGANPNVQIIASNENTFTHGYLFNKMGQEHHVDNVASFKKITYKEIYPHIDIEYIIHEETGLKYTIILHPGADPSMIHLAYSIPPQLAPDGSMVTATNLGNIIDHLPHTFYGDNISETIPTSYLLSGNQISFNLGTYDDTRTVIIDPWTQTPAFATNWDCVWECETDAAGNAYIIGGTMPLTLIKYNTAGALQWTYATPYDTTEWLGTMATDNPGNTYVTNGTTQRILKVNTGGVLQFSNNSPGGVGLSTEFWNISFNCDQTKLVVAGTGGVIPPMPYIHDINTTNGNVISSFLIGGSTLFNTQEVRSIVATENEKYYYMTHDSIGYVSQDFNLCPGGNANFLIAPHPHNFGYKCENWRVNNTGVEALAYFQDYVYVNRGNNIEKRLFATGGLVATAAIPGGGFAGTQLRNSGIIVDTCGNIFVGSQSQVVKFNTNLSVLATYAVPFNVYDVAISINGDIIAAGATGNSGNASRTGYVQSINGAACPPLQMECCNPSICAVPVLCTTDAPVTVTPETPGGTFSPAMPGFNPATGVFNPAVAGVGSFTIYYTLPCGTDSITIDVVICGAVTACIETNGSITASGGDGGPYTWQWWETQTINGDASSANCSLCGGFWLFGNCTVNSCTVSGWTTWATGQMNATPPGAATQIQITDPTGNQLTTLISALAPCPPLPVEMVSFTGKANGRNVDLFWTTSSELNNDYFTVERSANAIDFYEIGMVDGGGNSNQMLNYSFIDEHPNSLNYYRLKQTDFDGTYKYTDPISVNIYSQENPLITGVYPNPASTDVRFEYQGQNRNRLSIELVNVLGKTETIDHTGTTATGHTEIIDVSLYRNGVYYLVFREDNLVYSFKVIINH